MTEYFFARTTDVDASAAIAASEAAALSAQEAEASKDDAETAQLAAEVAQTAAELAETNAEAAAAIAEQIAEDYSAFLLTPKASDPLVDDNGDPLTTGDMYYSTSLLTLRAYNGSTWESYTPATGITQLLEDTSPQLGGNLDLNGFVITGLEIGTNVQAYAANLDDWSNEAVADYYDAAEVDTLLGDYLTTAAAASTYLTQASAAATYLTIANAASTYLPISGNTNSISISNAAPTITLTDTDTGADSTISADSGAGTLRISADQNNEAASTLIMFAVDGTNTLQLSSNQLRPVTGVTLSLGSTTQALASVAATAYEFGTNTDTTLTRSAAGKVDIEGHTIVTDDEVDQTLTAGFFTTALDHGTVSANHTPSPGDRQLQSYTNGGAHQILELDGEGIAHYLITNGASAGAITFSGWNRTDGDAFTTTNGHRFYVFMIRWGTVSYANVRALQ